MKQTSSRDNFAESSAKRISLLAIFAAAAMMLSYLEGLIPNLLPIPGFKPGLANTAVTLALLLFGFGGGAAVSILRILLTGILFSAPTQLFFSLGGGMFSLLASAAGIRFAEDKLSFFGLSVLSAAAHNIGQMLAAWIYFGDAAILGYLPWLLMLSTVTGSITGALMHTLFPRLNSIIKKGYNHE
ncbi:MAG: Gx transporter family protein [Clostridia bacterium]|nr:Gx transporter family protein [Clostridia bacterium]